MAVTGMSYEELLARPDYRYVVIDRYRKIDV